MEASSDSERIYNLQAEVEVLQYKLHELHATDVNTLRRGYVTVAQHVDALKLEASRLEALANELEPELYPPEYIAEEVGKAAVVSGTVYGIFTLVKTITPLPAKASRWIRNGLVAVTAIVVTWRFARSSIGRFAASLLDHKRRRKSFLKELAELQHRIDMLHALTSTMPGVPQHLRSRSLSASQATAAAAGPSTTAAASSEVTGVPSPVASQQEQFIVVDLPRVESGGFILPSPHLQSPTIASPAPDTVVVGHPVPAGAAAVVAGWDSSSTSRDRQQQRQQQEGLAAARSSDAGRQGDASLQGQASSSAATAVPTAAAGLRQQVPAATQQLLQQQAQQRASLDQQQQQLIAVPASAFVAPSSILGWGGVVSQQELALHPRQQQHQQQPAAAAATALGRQGREQSPDTDEGEWVEQPGVISDPEINNGSNGDAAGQQRRQQQQQGVSPASSTDEAVLLERE